ncbi:lipocalin-like domain-containing protein [Streptomyces sp. DSM 40750]|uniref:lipocalin-like domain-containing protein n=1 Tax=Streptomyces sp. DSM 40750 TaxID=2801030 RepID=UPI00214C573F|nr:lipocalin-like domain-containing protein [Streptomyces sp. DSM 40750]UUU19710.1 lipocalin-like domain-containing protein [Streptomyces sp. DSM 40750]
MTTKLRAPQLWLALALALALLVSVPLFAQASATERGTGSLVGVWRMTSLEVGTEGNLQPVPYSGQIVFSKSGTMSVQAMNPDANAPDTPYTKNGYEAFYGNFTISKSARTFVVTVQSSLARDLIGQSLTRAFRVSGNTLVLTPPNPAEGWRATYKRV